MHTWTGRAGRSRLLLLLLLVALGTGASEAASIGVTIVTPKSTGYWPGHLPVKVTVNSIYSLATVTAQVGARVVALTPEASGPGWVGTLDLSGITPSRLTLVVTASDVFGATATAALDFSLDSPPVLVVTSPQSGDVATPNLRITATCTDDGLAPCSVGVNQPGLGSAPGALDLVTSLATFDGQTIDVIVTARDSAGQQTTIVRSVHVIVPGAIVERDRLPPGSSVFDTDGSRVLFMLGEQAAIRDLQTGATQTVYDTPGTTAQHGALTPTGALVVGSDPSYPFASINEWRNGALTSRGGANSSDSLRVAGNWAIWSLGTGLIREDLTTAVTSQVSASAGNIDNDVAANGDVVFWSTGYQIERVRGGTTTPLTADTQTWSTYPRTDGSLVVFRRTPPCCASNSPSSIVLNEGGNETLLAPVWSSQAWPAPGSAYQVADGWVAFTTPDANGNRQAWARSPAGTSSQVSVFNDDVSLATPRAMDPFGRVLFVVRGLTYMGGPAPGAGARLGPGLRAWWGGGRWLLAYQSVLFDLAFTPGCSYTVTPSPASVGAGGGPLDLAVTTSPSCSWNSVSEVSWIVAGNTGAGTGTGAAGWVVAPNEGATRSGAVWVGGERVVVTQTGTDGATDLDGDLLPDAWEAWHGLNAFSMSGRDGANGDPDGDGVTNRDEFLQGTSPTGVETRYFAEGATSAFFDTRFAVLNPGDVDTVASFAYQRTGKNLAEVDVPVPARSRVTVDPKQMLGTAATEFSTTVEANGPLVVDRTMSWPAGIGYGAHAETAVRTPSTLWYLAEGATHGTFNLFYLVQNPNASAAQVRVRYLRPSAAPIEKTYTFAPTSRTNIWVDFEEFPAGSGQFSLANTDVSAVFEVLNNQPIIVERAMYADVAGEVYGAGHESAGVTAPALDWFLAEGATHDPFDLYVLVANATAVDAQVNATFLLPGGKTISRSYTVRAYSRFTVLVDAIDPQLASTAVSTIVHSTNGVPVIVERAMWWGDASGWYEAHGSAGATVTGTTWGLADGEVDAARGMDTYILIANPSVLAATVKVTLYYEGGGSEERVFGPSDIPGRSRFNVAASLFTQAEGRRFGAVVESLGALPAQIVVERAMYWDAAGRHWAAGTNALATKLQ